MDNVYIKHLQEEEVSAKIVAGVVTDTLRSLMVQIN